jgi:transcriptional regulator with XRE-family HTH domain
LDFAANIVAMLSIRITGSQLRAARCLAGLSQAQVAAQARLCRQSIKGYERAGEDAPSATVVALTRVVNVLEANGVRFLADGGVTLCRAQQRAAPCGAQQLAKLAVTSVFSGYGRRHFEIAHFIRSSCNSTCAIYSTQLTMTTSLNGLCTRVGERHI